MKVAIFENHHENQMILVHLLEEFFQKYELKGNITSFYNAIELITTNDEFDVLFLEMEFDEVLGIYIAEKFHLKHPRTKIIYIAQHPEYAVEAINYHASGFFVRPLHKEQIWKHLYKIILLAEPRLEFYDSFNIRHYVFIKHIVMIEAVGRNTILYFPHKTYKVYRSLKEWKHLLSDYPFAECIRGVVVNFDSILYHDAKRETILLINQKELCLTREFGKKFIQAYYVYMEQEH